MHTEFLDYSDGKETFQAFIASESTDKKRPCVVICHAWAGQDDHEREVAKEIARLGYTAFALDVFGKGVRGDIKGDNTHLIQPFLEDRALLLSRLQAGVKAARANKLVDADKMAAIGYCFGGLSVLDIARANDPDIDGVVSFHGLFHKPNLGEQQPIRAKVLILHGYDDPMATPLQMVEVADELTAAKADWQIHAYGQTLHAFTGKGLNAPERGVKYNADADRRSWQAMKDFLAEIFA